MKLYYISGPYRGKSKNRLINFFQVCRNVKKARKVAKDIWEMGEYALCPHSNTAFMDGVTSDDNFLEGDLEMLYGCNSIVMLPGYEDSEGAMKELKRAECLKKNIYFYEDGKLTTEKKGKQDFWGYVTR